MTNKHLYVFYLLMFISISAPAQNAIPVYKHLTTSDGLPSSSVFFIIQDSKGYMWFSTDHGVARYNGYEFKVFTSKDGLEDNTVFYLFEDVKGRIWMLTFSGKIFYYLDGKINPYKYNKAATEFVNGNTPNRIYVDSEENVYLGCNGELKIDSAGKTQKTISFDKERYSAFLIHQVSDSCIIASFEDSYKKTNPVRIFYKTDNHVDSLFSVPFITSRTGAVQFNKKEAVFSIASDFYLFKNDSAFHLTKGPFTHIFFLTKDKFNRIYACTDKGLYVYDDIINSESSVVYFPGKFVTCCSEDKEGGFWITTRDNGVYYLPNFAVRHFEISDERFAKPTCLVNNFKNAVYAGYWSGLVTQINSNEEKIIYTSPPEKKVYNSNSDNSRLYIAGDLSGYISEGKFHYIVNQNTTTKAISHLKNNFVKHADGFLYNTAQRSLLKIAGDTITERINCKHRINYLFENNQYQFILGCKDGAFLFSDSTSQVTSYNTVLENVSVEDIKYFHNLVCFATQGKGLIFLNGKQTFSINENNGLVNDLVNRIFIKENDIWCSTNNGISHVHFTDINTFRYNITNITIKEGLPSNEINDITFLNDTMWVATNSGICFFNSRYDFKNPLAPLVYLTSIRINGRDTSIQQNYSLSHDFNNLKISFEAISYKSQRDIRYRYILKTANDSISGYTRNRAVDFLSLRPGHYTFSILAKNSSGVWSENAAALSFTINPAWWQTWWFRFIIIASAGYVIYLYSNRRINRIRKAVQVKTEFTRKIATLETKALRAQMNPHFTFNVMNSIQHYILNNDAASAQKYLSKFARLIRLILDNSVYEEITLQEELTALQLYVDLEQLRFDDPFEFNLFMDKNILIDEVMVPPMLLQPYIENAVKHGIAHLQSKGKITMKIKNINQAILFTIEDNGVGRAQSSQWNHTNIHEHISHGTAISHDRIRAYNISKGKSLQVKFIDLKDAEENSSGTRVEIALPFLV